MRAGTGEFRADPRFAAIVRRSASSLSEGMAAHLTAGELATAGQLATLGEVFSVEAADRILQRTSGDIRSLIFKGILVEPTTATSPLPGSPHSAELPLAFTHSLIHRKLSETSQPDPATLAGIIADDCPLYTIVPIDLLAAAEPIPQADPAVFLRAIDRLIHIALELDKTPDWMLAQTIWNAAQRLLDIISLPQDERVRRQSALTVCSIRLHRRELHTPTYLQIVTQLADQTQQATDPYLMEQHIYACTFLCGALLRTDYERYRQVVEESDAYIAQHPQLKATPAFTQYFLNCISNERTVGNAKQLQILESLLETHTQDTGIPQKQRDRLALYGRFGLLTHFMNGQDLERRLRDIEYLESLDASAELPPLEFHRSKSFLYAHIGRVHDALQELDQVEKIYKDNGLMMQYFTMRLRRTHCLAGITPDSAALQSQLAHLITTAPENIRNGFYPIVRSVMNFVSSLRDDIDWVHPEIQGMMEQTMQMFHPALELIKERRGQGPTDAQVHTLLEQADPEDYISNGVAALILFPTEQRAAELRPVLDRYFARFEICRLTDISDLNMMAMLLPYVPGELLETDEYHQSVNTALHQAMEWLYTLGLHCYMRPILLRFPAYFTQEQIAQWEVRIQGIADREAQTGGPAPAPDTPDAPEKKMRLLFFGKTRFVFSGEDTPHEPRGNRLRTLLGVMAAQELLAQPLDRNEFLAIASDNPGDPKAARLVVNMTVSRLRDAMGDDAIRTDTDTPRLNTDILDVDVLNAFGLVAEAKKALRSGNIIKAQQCVRTALALWRGEVLFATLYDELFEKLREDFETGIVAVATATAQALVQAGDYQHAALILEKMHLTLPDDEEISGLYRNALEHTGRKGAAERARIRTEEQLRE